MGSQMNRRSLLAGAAWLAVLAGCAKVDKVTPSPSTTPTPQPGPTESMSTPEPTMTQAPLGIPLPDGPINVLIAGSDSRTHDLNQDGRSDVIVLAQLTSNRSQINLVSIARDTVAWLPSGGQGKINDAYATGGVEALATSVSQLLGDIPIHYTLETGFIWFTEIAEVMRGITVQNRFQSDSSGVFFPAGQIMLISEDALTYARERYGLPNGDLDRTERHRACLTGIVDWLGNLARSNAAFLAEQVPLLWARVRPGRGVTVEHILGMIEIAKHLSAASVRSAMLPVSGFGEVNGQSIDYIDQGRAAELIAQLHAEDISAYQATYGLDTSPTGG